MARKSVQKISPWIARTDADVPKIRLANRPLIQIYKHPRKWEVVFDLGQGFLGRNTLVFTNAGRLAIQTIMTSRRHKTQCPWNLVERIAHAHYYSEADAIAVAEALVNLADRNLEEKLWDWA